MKFNLNGDNNNPLDPFNNKKKRDPLDPLNENKKDLLPEDSEEIQIDPFGGKPPKKKPERKKKEKTTKEEKKEPQDERKEEVKASIEEISSKINLEKENPLETLTEPIKKSKAKKERTKKEGKPLNPKIKTAIFVAVPLLIVCLLLAVFKDAIIAEIIKVQDDKVIDSSQVMMPDVTGYTEKDALNKLHDLKLKTEVEYMYDQYTDNGTVIKCSVDPDNPVEKGAIIKVYICKDEDLAEVPEGIDYFKDVKLPDCPISKNSIILTSAKINDIYLTTVFKNNTSKKINQIKYTLGYKDSTGFKFINRTYIISNLNLNPQESISDKIELTNSKIDEITLEFIEYTYIVE